MPSDKDAQIQQIYNNFLQKITELKIKKLKIISDYRKQLDLQTAEKIKQEMNSKNYFNNHGGPNA